ncbi:uncharacterized protein LOC141663573 [Apium graveolens]|uniref:uncharacterized protein LOC141663568 n=1 Tax=Apium graveolens TaxID=4045 RepID=UPI003D7B52C8
MSSSTVEIEHFSHPEHPLVLKEDDVIGSDVTCSVCDKSVIGSPAYTCTKGGSSRCRKFYLHKSCAELPKEIIRDKLDLHPLVLQPRSKTCTCDVCSSHVRFAYACVQCDFDVCVVCAFLSIYVHEQKVIHHEGHKEHSLTSQRQALFKCDACWEEDKDYSYVCYTCDFWIHEKCASSPPIIPAPTYHHHPLTLIFSIPVMHRYFGRLCAICNKRVQSLCWSYYCHKCTFFVHIQCSKSTISLGNEIEEEGIVDDEPELVQFPLPSEESLFDLIITQCSKLRVEFQGEGGNSANIPLIANDPHIIKKHWSHPDHPLELHQLTISVNDNNDDDDDDDVDRRVLICDGCVQPITISHPSYYACIQCGFFLHSFCANQLPDELPVGASPFHPQHTLSLRYRHKKYFYSYVACGICNYVTNGFYYICETCDIVIDIRCAFLSTRIRHKSHKHHSLVQRPFSDSKCSIRNYHISKGVEYACETCSNFRISIECVFYPSSVKHRYDDHSLILRHPPFFYEGVFYCQICEEQVNNQRLLYHCDECDQSFHEYCPISCLNVKLGETIKHSIDNQAHTLALVIKRTTKRDCPSYLCRICEAGYEIQYFFECDGCGYLACVFCIREKYGR